MAAVMWERPQGDLSSLRTWIWVAWKRSRNPGHKSTRASRLDAKSPQPLPPVKNAFLKEAKTVNESRVYC